MRLLTVGTMALCLVHRSQDARCSRPGHYMSREQEVNNGLWCVFSPLPGPSVSATRPFSDWMRAAETVCTTLVHAGFRYIVFTHSYQYGGMQALITMAGLAPPADPLRIATQVLLLPLLNAADVAYNVVTLDHICAGRLDLGIGLAYHLKEVPLGGITRQERGPKFVE